MLRKVVKVRLYPTNEQKTILAQDFGSARWWWNYALNASVEHYKETNKGLTQVALNKLLPPLKKAEETSWLKNTYSQIFQAATLNLTTAYKNFFDGRAKFPRFKSRKDKQSIQYPQNVRVLESSLFFPGRLGDVKASVHRMYSGVIKTVTVSKNPSGKYFASVLIETEGEPKEISTDGNVAGIDLGLKTFAVISNGETIQNIDNPRHIAKHQRNLKRKQQSFARKKQGSKSREKAKKTVAKVYERVTNSRNDFLHKLSRRVVNENQVVGVEKLNTKGMVRNRKLAKHISDAAWGTFVNFLDYKLKADGKRLVEVSRWFPSSKLCSCCGHVMDSMPLKVREWQCPVCGKNHDRDANAAENIRVEAIRIIEVERLNGGNPVSASGGDVRLKRSCKRMKCNPQ